MGVRGSLWSAAPRGAPGAIIAAGLACLAFWWSGHEATAQKQSPPAQDVVQLQVVGGLADVSQYTKLEEPFWTQELPRLSNGRLQATIRPFDQSGLRGQEMLQLMRLGVVPFGNALLAVVSEEEPELNAVDLPGVSPDMATLRRLVALYRDHLRNLLRQEHGVELLAIYTYPAQVVFCSKSFGSLQDLKGRRIRTSSVGQSEMMEALGAFPVITPFSETVNAVTNGVVDCAITGALPGNTIGLADVTTHIHAMAINWGLAFFGANNAAWRALSAEDQAVIGEGLKDLEARAWTAAEQDTADGLACNTGAASCKAGKRAAMTLVPVSESDMEVRRRLIRETVLPRWVARCGDPCADTWNRTVASSLGLEAHAR